MSPEAQVTAIAGFLVALVAAFWWFITRIESAEVDRFDERARLPEHCPFCGAVARVNGSTQGDRFFVRCCNDACMLMGPYGPTVPAAVVLWNRLEVEG